MIPDAPQLDPTSSTDRLRPVVEAAADPRGRVHANGAVVPSQDPVDVPSSPVGAVAEATDHAEVADALERLRGALVAAGRSLDLVVAAAQAPERTHSTIA